MFKNLHRWFRVISGRVRRVKGKRYIICIFLGERVHDKTFCTEKTHEELYINNTWKKNLLVSFYLVVFFLFLSCSLNNRCRLLPQFILFFFCSKNVNCIILRSVCAILNYPQVSIVFKWEKSREKFVIFNLSVHTALNVKM